MAEAQRNPCVVFCPYLDLRDTYLIGDWRIGPATVFDGPWRDEGFKARCLQLLAKFEDADGQPIKSPALVWHQARGVDGDEPDRAEIRALQTALSLALLDTNPPWSLGMDGNWVATTDNSDLFIWRIDVKGGGIATQRGAIVTVTTGGMRMDDPRFTIRAPLELHMPMKTRLHAELAVAIYRVGRGDHDAVDATQARRVATASEWHAKAWRNTPSVRPEDQVVMIRTAFEAFTGSSDASEAIGFLEQVFARLKSFGAHDARFTAHTLWSPDEKPVRSFQYVTRAGKTRVVQLTDLGHWYSTFGLARHKIIHEGSVPNLAYNEPASRYNGPMFHTGERLLREALKANLVAFGYVDLWQEEAFRAVKKAIQPVIDRWTST